MTRMRSLQIVVVALLLGCSRANYISDHEWSTHDPARLFDTSFPSTEENQETLHDEGMDDNGLHGDEDNEMLDENKDAQYDAYDDYEGEDYSARATPYDIVYIIVATLGSIANALVVLTWSRVKQFNATTFLLSFLGVSDFLFVFVMIFIHIIFSTVNEYTYTIDWLFYCLVYLSYVGQFMSIFTTVLVSVTRYAAVKFPFQFQLWFKKFTTKIFVAAITVASVILAYPASTVACVFLYFFISPDYDYEGSGEGGYKIHTNSSYMSDNSTTPVGIVSMNTSYLLLNTSFGSWMSSTYSTIEANGSLGGDEEPPPQYPPFEEYKKIEVCQVSFASDKILSIITMAMTNIIPWLVVIPMNLLLVNQIRKSFKERKKLMNKEEESNRTLDIVVVILTIQSILAYPVFYIVELLTNREDWKYYFGSGQPPFPIQESEAAHVTSWRECLYMINSSANIVAYAACSHRFRKLLGEILWRAPRKEDTAPPSSSKQQINTVHSQVSSSVEK